MPLPEVADSRPVARFGELDDACPLCQLPALTHFDTAGRWAGCTKAEPGMIAYLTWSPPKRKLFQKAERPKPVPVDLPSPPAPAPTPGKRTRRFGRARYFSLLPPGMKRKQLNVIAGRSAHRRTVLHTIYDLQRGALATDIIEKTGLPPGTVQTCLRWLRDRHRVEQRKADDPASAEPESAETPTPAPPR